jgi:hypothetical protein
MLRRTITGLGLALTCAVVAPGADAGAQQDSSYQRCTQRADSAWSDCSAAARGSKTAAWLCDATHSQAVLDCRDPGKRMRSELHELLGR